MIAHLAVAVAMLSHPMPPAAVAPTYHHQNAAWLPADPFQRCAAKALAGDYGRLSTWQRDGYTRMLANGRPALFVVTQYNGDEKDGKTDRKGAACSLRHAALTKHMVIHDGYYRAYVWTPRHGIRQVLDCGANPNRSVAVEVTGRQDAIWLDVWYPHASNAAKAGGCDWTPTSGWVVR